MGPSYGSLPMQLDGLGADEEDAVMPSAEQAVHLFKGSSAGLVAAAPEVYRVPQKRPTKHQSVCQVV